MSYFVGIDVSMEESSICVVNKDGDEVLETVVETCPHAIVDALKGFQQDELKIAFETGPLTSWLWHETTALGVEAVVLDARSR